MRSSLKESYNSISKISESIDNINFIGLYRPWNEEWNWLYLFELTELETWHEIDAHFCEEFGVYGDNPGRFIVRMYEDARPWLTEENESLPQSMIRGRRIYHTQYYLSRRFQDPRMREFYKAQVELCARLKGIDFLSLFQPWNAVWNWTPVWMMDSLKNFIEMRTEFMRSFGFPEEITNQLLRFYERHEP
ncbi:MAG: hypothetical protein ABSA11_08115 [Candidatus Bathyarchaeia archaeon]